MNQILELTKKNSQVRIYATAKRIQDQDKVLGKLHTLRNLLHGKVKITTDIE